MRAESSSSRSSFCIVGAIAVAAVTIVSSGCSKTSTKWAQVQNVYQRRADLIPNLVNTVAGAANFEKSTLKQ